MGETSSMRARRPYFAIRAVSMSPVPFPALRHFVASEFQHPELVDADALQWLDNVRHAAGVPFRLTSDARTPAHNIEVGGSPTSLHVLGRAFDFTLRVADPAALYRVVDACMTTPAPFGKEIEYVIGDQHVHIGLFPDQRPSRLILKARD